MGCSPQRGPPLARFTLVTVLILGAPSPSPSRATLSGGTLPMPPTLSAAQQTRDSDPEMELRGGPLLPCARWPGCCRWTRHGNPPSCVALCGGLQAHRAEHRHDHTEELRRHRSPGGHGTREAGAGLSSAAGEGGRGGRPGPRGGRDRGLSGWRGRDGAFLRGSRSLHATVGPTGSATGTPSGARRPRPFLSHVFTAGACARVVAASPAGARTHSCRGSKPGPRAGGGRAGP